MSDETSGPYWSACPDCPFTANGETMEEMIADAKDHMIEAHGIGVEE